MSVTKASGKLSTSIFNSVQKPSFVQNGRPTSTASLKSSWDLHKPLGKDRWSLKDDFDGYKKPLSTMAYARKLQCEEELRAQTKAMLQVPVGQIVKQIPKKGKSNIFNEL